MRSTAKVRSATPSFFLSRTPLEIRLQIYKEVIDYCNLPPRVHIVFDHAPEDGFAANYTPLYQAQRKLTFRACITHNLNGERHHNWTNMALSGIPKNHWPCLAALDNETIAPLRSTYSYWSMLLTCHQMYSEVVDLFYSSFAHKGFDILDLPTAHRFFQLVPQQELNRIKSLQITASLVPYKYLSVPDDVSLSEYHEERAAEWLDICESLRSMSGLCDLRIIFFNYTLHNVLEQELLAPLWKDVKVQDNFVVELPWVYEPSPKVDAAPYKIERRTLKSKNPPFIFPNPYQLYYPLRKRKSRSQKVIEGTWKVLSWPFAVVGREIISLRPSS